MRTASTVVHRTAPRHDVTGTRRRQICLLQIAGDNRAFRSIYGFDTRPDQLDRTFSTDWFLIAIGTRVFPRSTSATIDRVTPNPTEIASPGATAQNLFVGQAGTGMLTIQTAGTLINLTGTVGSLPGSNGTVTVTGAGSTWSNLGSLVVGDAGTGTLTIDNGGTVISGFGNLTVGQTGTGMLTIQNGGTLTNIGGFLGNSPGGVGTVTVSGAARSGRTRETSWSAVRARARLPSKTAVR